jgi:hypothetical protein
VKLRTTAHEEAFRADLQRLVLAKAPLEKLPLCRFRFEPLGLRVVTASEQVTSQIEPLPYQLGGELNKTRRSRGGNASEVRTVASVSVGLLKLRMVPGVKKLCPNQQPYGLSHSCELPHSDIPVVQARTVENGGAGIAKVACRRNWKTSRIKPQEAIVANIVRKLAIATVAHTIGEMVEVQRVGLVRSRQ